MNSNAIKLIHRWFAWLLVFPLAAGSFSFASYWTLHHNPLTAANSVDIAGIKGLPNLLARSKARTAKLQVILDATKSELQQINQDIVSYKGKAVATKAWAATQSTTAPATSGTTGASGVKK
jgi:hypothetical protein